MTTTKPRTEVPKIEPLLDQEFILTKEEVAQACTNFVIATRSNCRFNHNHRYIIFSPDGVLKITLQQVRDK